MDVTNFPDGSRDITEWYFNVGSDTLLDTASFNHISGVIASEKPCRTRRTAMGHLISTLPSQHRVIPLSHLRHPSIRSRYLVLLPLLSIVCLQTRVEQDPFALPLKTARRFGPRVALRLSPSLWHCCCLARALLAWQDMGGRGSWRSKSIYNWRAEKAGSEMGLPFLLSTFQFAIIVFPRSIGLQISRSNWFGWTSFYKDYFLNLDLIRFKRRNSV